MTIGTDDKVLLDGKHKRHFRGPGKQKPLFY